MTSKSTPKFLEESEPFTLSSVRCNKCIFFSKKKLVDKSCSQYERSGEAFPCKNFTIDHTTIKIKQEVDDTVVISEVAATLLPNIPTSKIEDFIAVLCQETKTRKNGFAAGQVVYFKHGYGGDYLSNYVRAIVIRADNVHVYVTGKDGFSASLVRTSILTAQQWLEKVENCVEEGRTIDPNIGKLAKSDALLSKVNVDFIKSNGIEDYTPTEATPAAILPKGSVAIKPSAAIADVPTKSAKTTLRDKINARAAIKQAAAPVVYDDTIEDDTPTIITQGKVGKTSVPLKDLVEKLRIMKEQRKKA